MIVIASIMMIINVKYKTHFPLAVSLNHNNITIKENADKEVSSGNVINFTPQR